MGSTRSDEELKIGRSDRLGAAAIAISHCSLAVRRHCSFVSPHLGTHNGTTYTMLSSSLHSPPSPLALRLENETGSGGRAHATPHPSAAPRGSSRCPPLSRSAHPAPPARKRKHIFPIAQPRARRARACGPSAARRIQIHPLASVTPSLLDCAKSTNPRRGFLGSRKDA